jgi:Ser/Thr protein kinase RdoA (MazF antagonist)
MDDASDEALGAAAREALAAFGVRADRLTLASRSENITFRAEVADGDAFSLRLHRPGYHTLEELNSERVWTRALADAGHAVPDGLETADGRHYAPVQIAGGETRLAGMTRWIEGDVLADVLKREHAAAPLADYFAKLGDIAAGLHAHSETWRPPAGFTRHAVDADGLMSEAPHWGAFWDHAAVTPAERALLTATRGRLHAALNRLPRDPLRFGMIHADLHHGNLLVNGERLTVIDFDDAAFGWYLYDLAVSLGAYEARADFADLQAALLRGYRTRRALSAEAEALLPMFLLVRRLAVIGWLHQRPEIDPGPRLAELKALALAGCQAFGASRWSEG